MRAWDSVTQGNLLRPGPAGFAILLAGLLLSLAPVSLRMEAVYYDFLQGLQRRTSSPQIVLVDTGELNQGSGTVWEASAFPALLNALKAARARLVIPVEPPPLRMALPDSAQLAALAELERRSREQNGDAVAKGPPLPDTFGRQLSEIRHRSELHDRTVEAAAAARNLIVGVPTFDGNRGAEIPPTNCLKHVFQPNAGAVDVGARAVRAVVPPSDTLCAAVLAAGHVEFWPDADGVVRRMELLVSTSGTLVSSAALRAALAIDYPGSKAPDVTRDLLSWNSRSIRMTAGSGILLRFYKDRPGKSAFETLDARSLLDSSDAASRVAGRIVILGDVTAKVEPAYATSITPRMSPAVLLATGTSNLLEDDYLVRPPWLSWIENAVLILIGIAVVVFGSRAPALSVAGGIVAAALLLVLEAYLVIASGVWAQLATGAAFALFATTAIRFLQPRRAPAPAFQPALAPAGAGAAEPAPAPAPVTQEDELDLAFSMLRHQSPTEHVKKRLYDVALEHARRRDLAKAERVLRHLANVDPNFRNAGEKLRKLAGLRSALPEKPPAAATDSPRPVLRPMPETEDLSGRTIGRYQLEQAIGRGAMATVYLGKDPKINRRVAIKTIALAEEFGDTDLANARAQFLREAESAGRLNHPNIISIYDAGEDGRVAYLAMEYFPGKPLSFYAQQGQLLQPRRAFELMARAAEALHYAHGQHVVHRDVKPANLLYDADTDILKITDFGIARLTDTSRTKTGIILGTPSYMSPEQLAGTSVTGQSDLFSLAVTLYQLLTGVPPFRADSIPMLMQKIAHERHEPVASLRNDLPPCVDTLFDQALAKDPADRYPSGRAMALALRDCCSSFASAARNQA